MVALAPVAVALLAEHRHYTGFQQEVVLLLALEKVWVQVVLQEVVLQDMVHNPAVYQFGSTVPVLAQVDKY